MDELNELEKIGLAFIGGLIAGCSLEKASVSDEKNEKEEAHIENNDDDKVTIKKIEGEKADKFIKMIKELEEE